MDENLPGVPPQVGACEMARVHAIVVRACALVSNETANPADDSLVQDSALNTTTRAMLEPLLAEARLRQR